MKRARTLQWHPRALDDVDLRGTTAIIVGGTGGIGRAFAHCLSEQGAQVIVVGRTFRDATRQGIAFVAADLSSVRRARTIAQELPAAAADLVIFTAGIIAAPKREVTDEGIERDMAVSYLNRFVMLEEMAPRLGAERTGSPSARPRVFVVGFPGVGHVGQPDDLNAERDYKAWPAHLNTVAANEALVLDAVTRYPAVDCFGLNPGVIKSGIRSNFLGGDTFKGRVVETLLGWFAPSVDDYARRLTPLLVAPEIEGRSGAMFDRKGRAVVPSSGLTQARIERFMKASRDLATKVSAPDQATAHDR